MGMMSIIEAERIGLEQLYEFGPDSAIEDFGPGRMSYIDWLRLEEHRINKNSLRRAAIVYRAKNSNDVALFVNRPANLRKS